MIHKGYLVIADISGYTAFLTQLELEHARDILDSLLNTLVEEFHAPFTIVKLEGDAILTYIPDNALLQGQTLLEAIERIYFTFRLARDNIHRACHCQACTLAGTLDLKFIAHHGQFTIQTFGAVKDLQGADLIVIHRLLKNKIIFTTGVVSYAFFTQASVNAGGLSGITQTMIPHSETYEHLGEVKGYVHNLADVWAREQDRRRTLITSADAWISKEFDLPVSPALAWDYLNDTKCLCQWCGLESVTTDNLKWGRLGIGGARYCVHAKGKTPTVETILDYQPFDYVTVRTAMPNGFIVQTTTHLTATETGSRVGWYASRPIGKDSLRTLLASVLSPIIRGEMIKEFQTSETALRKLIVADLSTGKIAPTTV